MTSPPYTAQYVAPAEGQHRYIVETGLSLLHTLSLPKKFWTHAFQATTYLINRLPTPLLTWKSPYESLFQVSPTYDKLHIFGCRCYPWLHPYNTHKLEPCSRPCIFLGYSIDHHAFKCFNRTTNKLFISRHVTFVENSFPYSQLAIHHSPSNTDSLSFILWQSDSIVPTTHSYPPPTIQPSPSTNEPTSRVPHNNSSYPPHSIPST